MLNNRHVTPGVELKKPQGQNLNKLGKALLGDATYQISRLYKYALWFQEVFHVFPL